jgi:hypothetical protein
MIGCAFRALVLVAVAGTAAWFSRPYWGPFVGGGRGAAPAEAPLAAWTAVSDGAATRAEGAARALARVGGPAFVQLDGADAAALALADLQRRLPSGLRDVAVRVQGDRVEVRAVVRPAEFGGKALLGPVYSLLPERDTVTLGGTLEGLRAGLGQYRVRDIRFRDLPLPPTAIAPLLRQVVRGTSRPAGLADDAIPVPLPPHVGDVRVRDGRITLYRATP